MSRRRGDDGVSSVAPVAAGLRVGCGVGRSNCGRSTCPSVHYAGLHPKATLRREAAMEECLGFAFGVIVLVAPYL